MTDKPVEHALVPSFADLGNLQGVAERPQAIDPMDSSGKEDITPDEVRLPRLTVAQGLHPQLVSNQPEYIQGLSIGQMFNDVTKEIYGTGPLTVVPIYRHVTWLEFDPNDKKVVKDRNVPPGDPRRAWREKAGPKGEDLPPLATEFVQFVSLLIRPGHFPEKMVVSIKTTNKEMRAAAELWTTYIDGRHGPIYSGLYQLTSMMVNGKNKEGQKTLYGVFVVKNAGYIPTDTPTGAMLYDYAKTFHKSAKGKAVEVVMDVDTVDADEFDPEKLEQESQASKR